MQSNQSQDQMLVKLSREISNSRSNVELLNVICHLLKSYIHFDDCYVLLYDHENKSYKTLLFHIGKRSEDAEFKKQLEIAHSLYSFENYTDLPQVLDVELLLGNGHKGLGFMHEAGIKEFANLRLYYKDEFIGLFVMLTEIQGVFNSDNLHLLKNISYQIAAASLNIRDAAEIARREDEKSILLSLSGELSALKSRADLHAIINGRIKKIFSIEELGIAKIDDNGKTYRAFIIDQKDNITNDVEFEATTAMAYEISDPLFSRVMQENDPVAFNVDEIAEMPEMPGFVHFWKKMGRKQVLCLPMKAGRKNIGMLVLHLDTGQTLTVNNDLIKGVCSQLSTAVSNILVNEEIIKREKERELLLSLNLDIAAVRNYDDLLQVISNRLKKILGFSDTLIALINDDKDALSTFLLDPKSRTKDHPIYSKDCTAKFPLNDGILDKAAVSEVAHIFSINELKEIQELPLYLKVNFESGMNQAAVIRFSRAGEVFGFWILFFEKNIMPNIKWISLIEGLANQISVALSNIIADEEIKKREWERNQLLQLNMDLTAVRTNEDLMIVITKKLKEILLFSHAHLTRINEDQISVTPYLYDPDSKSKDHPLYGTLKGSRIPIEDGILNKSMATPEPTLVDLDQLETEQELPLYAKVNFESGIQQVITTRFTSGDRIFGFWMLFFDKKIILDQHKSSLIKGISDQMSIAIANIIAEEEIKKREYERNTLLLLNMDLAAVRTNEDLMFVITEKLKKILHFSHAHLVRINDDRISVTPFLYDPNSRSQSHPLYSKLKGNKFLIEDGILNKSIITADPTIIDFDQLEKEQELPLYGIINYESGIQQVVTTRFIIADKVFGFWMMFFDKKIALDAHQSSLIKGISDQMSIAIANIFAIQEIEVREKEKSMLLDLSNSISKVRNKNDLRQIIDEKLKTLLVFNNISFCYVSPDGKTFGSFILDPNSPSVKHPEYGDITAKIHPVNDGIINKVLASEDPLVYDMEAYIETNNKVPDYFRMIYDVGMRQMIFSRLQNGENTIGYLAITKKVKMHIDINQLNLIKAISAQLSVALANINANEQIENQIKEIKKYKNQLEEENSYLLEEINNSFSHSDIISVSGEMKKVFHLVQQGAPSDSTVLLLGETGTGKELIARAIHNSSPRFNKIMVKVNCAALPANLIESELFGHERGSFTGAIERRIGKFELANNGTLFLDEIGEMPLELQVKLLRALQEKEIERLGGKTTIKVDVRIIAATNRNLEQLMEEGKFRSDLYYRLNIFPINLPPLRDRKEDIPALTSHFIKRFSKKTGKKITNLSNKALQEMMQYNWPGNIRELEHLIERSVLLNTGETLKGIVLPVKNSNTVFKEEDTLDIKTIDENERAYIMKILKYTDGRIAGFGGAAELLGIPPTTLHSRMKRLGIKKEHLSGGKQ